MDNITYDEMAQTIQNINFPKKSGQIIKLVHIYLVWSVSDMRFLGEDNSGISETMNFRLK